MRVGVVIVAYGERARCAAEVAIISVHRWHDWPVTVIAETPLDGAAFVHCDTPGQGARGAKLRILELVDYDAVLYLDADTQVISDATAGFAMIGDGWDMVMAHSDYQFDRVFYHVGPEERLATIEEIANPLPLQLQAGVMFIRRCVETIGLFQTWQQEWARWGDQDQAALWRALTRCPVRLLVLGRPWNGGAVIEHHFGAAR